MNLHLDSRLRFLEAHASRRPERLSDAVIAGLSAPQKSLPCRFFYDEAGSRLFELICDLPEYYLTRAERSILERFAPDMLAAAGCPTTLVEFGSGSGCKTRLLLDAANAKSDPVEYIPIDISGEFLYNAAHDLLNDYPMLTITAIAAEYNDAIAMVPPCIGARLFLFMGSNIGNFSPTEAVEFLTQIHSSMSDADSLLVGYDLCKDTEVLEAAYNDGMGITARFNKNLLRRINRELGADFEINQFDHSAPFVESDSRIEMRLVSLCNQKVRVDAIADRFTFLEGEFIHTENSYKYAAQMFEQLSKSASLRIVNQWTDERTWFSVSLLKRIQTS